MIPELEEHCLEFLHIRFELFWARQGNKNRTPRYLSDPIPSLMGKIHFDQSRVSIFPELGKQERDRVCHSSFSYPPMLHIIL